jgi:hypothetical protein
MNILRYPVFLFLGRKEKNMALQSKYTKSIGFYENIV